MKQVVIADACANFIDYKGEEAALKSYISLKSKQNPEPGQEDAVVYEQLGQALEAQKKILKLTRLIQERWSYFIWQTSSK